MPIAVTTDINQTNKRSIIALIAIDRGVLTEENTKDMEWQIRMPMGVP